MALMADIPEVQSYADLGWPPTCVRAPGTLLNLQNRMPTLSTVWLSILIGIITAEQNVVLI